MPFFPTKKPSASELISDLYNALQVIQSSSKTEKVLKKPDKPVLEFSKCLSHISEKFSSVDNNSEFVAQLCREIYTREIITLLIKCLPRIDSEIRKEVVDFINFILHRKVGARMPTVDFFVSNPNDTIFELFRLYPSADSAIIIGILIRNCLKYEEITRLILQSDQIYDYFDIVNHDVFDVAADAFSTFKDILTRHKEISSEFLSREYNKFFTFLNGLISSDNYVTKRQSIRLLGELLLENTNHTCMVQYVDDSENLKLIMNLLCHKNISIQFEAFHIFKIFVANPNKTPKIAQILKRNQERLIDFFKSFQPNKETDDQFNEEKEYLVKAIAQL